MGNEEIEEIIMSIIIEAGNAKAYAYEALANAKKGNFAVCEEMLEEASNSINKAHEVQTDMIRKEAESSEKMPITMIFVHAQDHLMTVLSDLKIIDEMIETHKELYEIKKHLGMLK